MRTSISTNRNALLGVALTICILVPSATSFSPVASPMRKVTTSNSFHASAPVYGTPAKLQYSTMLFLGNEDSNEDMNVSKRNRNFNHGVHPILLNSWKPIRQNFQKQNRKAMTIFAAALLMMSTFFTPLEALAAPSGGRMGGGFGGSSRSSSSSRTYSSPRSYNRGYSRGYSSGYYSRPSVTVVPSIGGYGYYGAPVVAPAPAIGWWRGPSIIDIMIFGFFASAVVSSVLGGDSDTMNSSSALGSGVTVAKISVALNVPNRSDRNSILSYLHRLSATANTDSRVGISNLVSQVALELLRQKRSIFAADTEYIHFKNGDSAQRDFSSKAIQERSKFEMEKTNKYEGVDYSSFERSNIEALGNQATSAVVTLVIAIDGDQTKLPQINSVRDLETALTKIATDVKVDDCLRSAEVLWTPDDDNDILSQRDVIVDYPKLRTI